VPQLVGHVVMFEDGAIGVVVGWVAIDEAIEEEGIEGEAPVGGRLVVGMVIPLAPVIDWIDGGAVLVEIEANLSWIEAEGRRGQAEGRQQSTHRAPQHGVARSYVPIGPGHWTSGGEGGNRCERECPLLFGISSRPEKPVQQPRRTSDKDGAQTRVNMERASTSNTKPLRRCPKTNCVR